MSYTGQCYCGLIKYRIEGEPRFVAHDHCSICRRISGAAFVTWVGIKETQLTVQSGSERLTRFQSTHSAERQFCSQCGSHLFFRGSRWPNEVHVTLATIVSGPVLEPKAHVFFSDKADWLKVGDELPKFGGKSGTEKLS